MKWSYGVTTVPERRHDLLPRTLASLKLAGFEEPHLFVDSEHGYAELGLPMTVRYPKVRTAGNWVLSAMELYIRNPHADRYAVFQDDFVTYRNLRVYLERTPYPQRGYCNLYSFPSNEELAKGRLGWYESNQFGRGAVALMFSREALLTCLGSQHLLERPQDSVRGHVKVDGGIVDAMRKAGWKEYVHNPSLVQHMGHVSTMGNGTHKQSRSFKGEEFNALEMLR